MTKRTGGLGHSQFDKGVLIGSFQRQKQIYIYKFKKQTASLSQKESSLRRLLEFNAQFGIIFLIIYGTNQRFQYLSKASQERCDILRSSIFNKSWSSGSAVKFTWWLLCHRVLPSTAASVAPAASKENTAFGLTELTV